MPGRLRLRGAAEMPLFSSFPPPGRSETLVGIDGDVTLHRCWLPGTEADALLGHVRCVARWTQERRKMYDRFVDVPREQAWFGDDRERPFTRELDTVRRRVECFTEARFSYVLLNRYRDGRDGVAWHNDREVAGLVRPVIASLTLGATRAFDLRPKSDRSRLLSVDLDHGDLLVMRGETQTHWEHRVAKDARIAGERINLTFRQMAD